MTKKIIEPTRMEMEEVIPFLEKALQKEENIYVRLPRAKYVCSRDFGGRVAGRIWSEEIGLRLRNDESKGISTYGLGPVFNLITLKDNQIMSEWYDGINRHVLSKAGYRFSPNETLWLSCVGNSEFMIIKTGELEQNDK